MRSPIRTCAARTVAFALAGVLVLAGCLSPGGTSGGDAGDGGMPKRVTMTIPYSPGGGTDTWGRFMAPYLEKHLPSQPSFTPENKEGGEGITGTNEYVKRGGTDGQQVLVTTATTYFQSMLGRKEAEFDMTKLVPLIINGSGGIIYVSDKSGIKSVEDLKNPPQQLKYGAISATGLDLSVLIAFQLLGLDVDATTGFEGRGPAALALQRGELNIDYQTTSAYNQQIKPLVKEGKAKPLMTLGWLGKDGDVVRDPEVPDLPSVVEVYEKLTGKKPSGEAYEAYKTFLAAGVAYQKGLWANPGTSQEIIDEYADAVEKMRDDKDFTEKSGAALGGYPLYTGPEVAEDVKKSFEVDPAVRTYVLDMLEKKYDTKVETN